MNDYIERLIDFCINEPLWALAFFIITFVKMRKYWNRIISISNIYKIS